MVRLSAWWSFGRDFGDGGAGGGLVDDALIGGERGQQGLQGEVVDRAWVAAAGLVDQRGGVVGEQGVGSSGQGEVVAQVVGGGLLRYANLRHAEAPGACLRIRLPERIRRRRPPLAGSPAPRPPVRS